MTLREARKARRAGITLLTVAAEPWIDRYVLSAIASFPYQYNMIVAPSYRTMPNSNFTEYLVNSICNSQLAYLLTLQL